MFFCLNMNFIWKVFVEKHYPIKKPIRNSIFVLSKYSCKCLGNTGAYLYGRKLILMIKSIGGRDRYRFFEPEPIAELEPVDRFLPVLFLLADLDEKKKYGIYVRVRKKKENREKPVDQFQRWPIVPSHSLIIFDALRKHQQHISLNKYQISRTSISFRQTVHMSIFYISGRIDTIVNDRIRKNNTECIDQYSDRISPYSVTENTTICVKHKGCLWILSVIFLYALRR